MHRCGKMSREVVVRLASFIAVALAMAAWETAAPRRRRIVSRGVRWPANLGIRFIVVTPDMHRVHHSVIRRETDSNFGFNLPWWDRIGGTYRDQPSMGHDAMTIGLARYQEAKRQTFSWMILLPFRHL